jgi:hypothetical protein
VVVEPEGRHGVGRVKHKAHRFDTAGREIGQEFVVSRTTEEYGEPADHRAAIVNSELVVVYQCLVWREQGPRQRGGPAERDATEQSLMLTRFKLDGTEIMRKAIVAHASDFAEDNFPDHCLLWSGTRLLVSTGSTRRKLTIREVDLDANVLATHVLSGSGTIGNSLLLDGTRLRLFSSTGPSTGTLSATDLTSDFAFAAAPVFFKDRELEQSFPTGNLTHGGFTFVAHIARAWSGSHDMNENPYSPYLKVLDTRDEIVFETRVGERGAAHVHPTLTRIGDRIFFAWSKNVSTGRTTGPRMMPQVQVAEYSLR